MVKRKSLTLAQARKSLRAFYAQKAGKRRGCGSGHKRRSNKRGGQSRAARMLPQSQPKEAVQMQRDIVKVSQGRNRHNVTDSLNRMTTHHDDSDLVIKRTGNQFQKQIRDAQASMGPRASLGTVAQKRQMQAMARKEAPNLKKIGVTPRGSFEVGGRRKRRSNKRKSNKRKSNKRRSSKRRR